MKKIVVASLICIFASPSIAQTQSITSQIQALKDAKDYVGAFNLMKKHAIVSSPELKAQTTADYSVFLLKAASAENPKGAKPLLKKAVSLQEDILNEYAKDWDTSKKIRYLADTIVAYTENAQYYEAISIAESFNGQEIPDYAQESLFKSYSQTRQYQKAFDTLNALKDKNPDNFGLFKQKVFLLCDMQLYSKAQAVVKAMEPTLDPKKDEYRQLQHLKALTYLYANNYAKAQEILTENLTKYPKKQVKNAFFYAFVTDTSSSFLYSPASSLLFSLENVSKVYATSSILCAAVGIILNIITSLGTTG